MSEISKTVATVENVTIGDALKQFKGLFSDAVAAKKAASEISSELLKKATGMILYYAGTFKNPLEVNKWIETAVGELKTSSMTKKYADNVADYLEVSGIKSTECGWIVSDKKALSEGQRNLANVAIKDYMSEEHKAAKKAEEDKKKELKAAYANKSPKDQAMDLILGLITAEKAKTDRAEAKAKKNGTPLKAETEKALARIHFLSVALTKLEHEA